MWYDQQQPDETVTADGPKLGSRSNALGIYVLFHLFDAMVAMFPLRHADETVGPYAAMTFWLMDAFGSQSAGCWAFTLLLTGFWWAAAVVAYRYRLVWKV